MTESVSVLIIEDNSELAEDAENEIKHYFYSSVGIEIAVVRERSFDEGLNRFRRGEGDVLVLDVRRDRSDQGAADETAGCDLYEKIKRARFAPVVFWTAIPEKVRDEEMPPLVTVVSKEDADGLLQAVRDAVDSRAVATMRGIEDQVLRVLREHMWEELAPHWSEYVSADGSQGVVQVLRSRLSRALEEQSQPSTSDASHRYIYPPVSELRAPGDVLEEPEGDGATWWVTLTPACDFAQKKFEFALLAKAKPLAEHPKFRKWSESPSKNRWNELKDVLRATQGRYHYLPQFRDIPDLVVDLEDVRAVPDTDDDLGAMRRVASLASPFVESLLVQHSQFRGRIGVPDLDVDALKKRLTDGL